MIARYATRCPGCGATILLRLGVGLDIEQPFFYVCKACGAATRGKVTIWYEPTPGGKVEFEEGKTIDLPEEPDQIVTIHPDFPSRADARDLSDEQGSAFQTFFQLLGKPYLVFDRNLRQFRAVCDNEWPKVRRMMGYYLDSNWTQFDTEGARLFEKAWPEPNEEWHRHDFMQHLLELVIAPACTVGPYPDMKVEYNALWGSDESKLAALRRFAEEHHRNGDVVARQRDVFHCLELYVEHRSAVLPALALDFVPAAKRRETEQLRLFRDEFSLLRDLYLATFEACHHALEYLVATVNIVKRGSPNAFGSSKPKNLAKFRKMSSARKATFLTGLPVCEAGWAKTLDRGLRNHIAHHSVRHDLPSGQLVKPDGGSVAYVEFVQKTLWLANPILFSSQVLKMVHIVRTLLVDP